jgi:hypothetical protein
MSIMQKIEIYVGGYYEIRGHRGLGGFGSAQRTTTPALSWLKGPTSTTTRNTGDNVIIAA